MSRPGRVCNSMSRLTTGFVSWEKHLMRRLHWYVGAAYVPPPANHIHDGEEARCFAVGGST
jgi:hypothetical protein